MGSEAEHQDRGEQSQLEHPRPQSSRRPLSAPIGNDLSSANVEKDLARARAPTPKERTPGERRVVELPQPAPQEDQQPKQPTGSNFSAGPGYCSTSRW